MIDDLQIRPAQPKDDAVASVLLSSAYSHRQVPSPSLAEHKNRFNESLQHFFRQDGNRFSYQNIYVAEGNTEVVGLVLSFGGRDEERLNAATGWALEHEAQDDEWYVDALAVFKEWGRKGIGTRLLHTAEQQARQHHYRKIALNVAQENEEALSLYQHLHYAVTHETFLYQRRYIRMVKMLETR